MLMILSYLIMILIAVIIIFGLTINLIPEVYINIHQFSPWYLNSNDWIDGFYKNDLLYTHT